MKMMRSPGSRLACAALMLGTLALAACDDSNGTAVPPTLKAEASCAALEGMNIPAAAIGKPTSGAIVQTATFVAAAASGNSNGEYCATTGIVLPVSADAPNMEFQVNLPTLWNGKALQLGGDGYDGTLKTGLDPFVAQPKGAPNALVRGYVTLGGDGGHKGSVFDGTFALNDEALLNYGQLSVKKVHDVAQAIMRQRYGVTPTRFYFIGGSQGGHEALDAAARYSADYDGVVAHYPAYNLSLLQLASVDVGKALYENGGAGWINNTKRALLVGRVKAACDGLDGLTDGIIGNIAGCNATFNIDTVRATLRCPDGADTGDTCLSDAQIAAVERISSPYDLGFPIAGQQVFARWPLLEGAEFTFFGVPTLSAFGVSPVPTPAAEAPADAALYFIGAAHARFFVAKDPTLDPLTFEPAAFKERIQALGDITEVTSQSLEPFRARGGKLILTHGTADTLISPHNTEDYYQRQVAALGQSTVDSFVRFYMIPGWDHGFGTYDLGFDGLAALEAWVERGQAPEVPIGIDNNATDPATARLRPMCRWPAWPKFTGTPGTENNPLSYTCALS